MQADPLRWKALTVVCAAFFMTILDVSIVNVALPSIGTSLHFSQDNLQWVITAYAISYAVFCLKKKSYDQPRFGNLKPYTKDDADVNEVAAFVRRVLGVACCWGEVA